MYRVTGTTARHSRKEIPMQRSPLKALVIAATIAAMLLGLMAPAAAQTTSSDVARDAAADKARPVDTRDEVQRLKIRCNGTFDRDGMPGVRCKWSRPTADDAAFTVLMRKGGDSDRWAPIFRTKNVKRNGYLDTSVEPGVRYRYRVRVFNADHRLVAVSRATGAGVPIPDFDVLRIACNGGTSDTGDKVASCEWSGSDDARGYQLWRIVNRGPRELVGTYGAETLAARDTNLPDDTRIVRYAVLALDNEGEIVGRSRVVKVRFRDVALNDQA